MHRVFLKFSIGGSQGLRTTWSGTPNLVIILVLILVHLIHVVIEVVLRWGHQNYGQEEINVNVRIAYPQSRVPRGRC